MAHGSLTVFRFDWETRHVATCRRARIIERCTGEYAYVRITQQQKLETCTFGANNQKLTGQARNDFITKCMSDEASPQKPK
jgi:psiF repeat